MGKPTVVLLPVNARSLEQPERRWLAQGDVSVVATPATDLARVLAVFDVASPVSGLASLRAWGDFGQRPESWLCGADPVFLEAQLDRVFMRTPRAQELTAAERVGLIDALEAGLPSPNAPQFQRLGDNGYYLAEQPIVTADLPATEVQGLIPPQYLPRGPAAAGHNRLVSEVQMALYECPVNLNRIAAGKEPITSIWLWGGGQVPCVDPGMTSRLYCADPLLRGYWFAAEADVNDAPAAIDLVGEVLVPDSIVDLRMMNEQPLTIISVLRMALARRMTQELVLLFADAICVRLRHRDRLRFWRRQSSLVQ